MKTLQEIADIAGITRQAVSIAIKRGGFGKRAALKIARATGTDERVWLYGPSSRIKAAIIGYNNRSGERRTKGVKRCHQYPRSRHGSSTAHADNSSAKQNPANKN